MMLHSVRFVHEVYTKLFFFRTKFKLNNGHEVNNIFPILLWFIFNMQNRNFYLELLLLCVELLLFIRIDKTVTFHAKLLLLHETVTFYTQTRHF